MAPDRDDRDDAPPDGGSIHDEIQALLSEHLDGSLSSAESTRIAQHLATCPACTAARDELREMRAALSGLGKLRPAPPPEFRDQVTEAIHRRSAGRFFARRTLGDRVPFGALLIVAMVVFVAVAALLWSSSTGSLRVPPPAPAAPPPDPAHPPAAP
jgi:anti-sigma factor RsiW